MARNPAAGDQIDHTLLERERVRQARLVSRAHTETKTFIVGGTIDNALFIPWVGIAINLDGESAEWKSLISLAGRLRLGEVEFNWELDDVEIYSGHIIDDTAWTSIDLDEPIVLTPGWHTLRAVPFDGTGVDLSAAYATSTGRR